MKQVLSLTEPELDWLIKTVGRAEVDNPTEQEVKDDLTASLGTLKAASQSLESKRRAAQ